jgi:hypothetical protein
VSTDSTAYNRQYQRDLRRRWRREGRCVNCGAFRDRPPRVTCGACLAAVARRMVSRYRVRRDGGLCVRCGEPAVGAMHCDACRSRHAARFRDQYAALRTEHAAYVQRTGRRLTLTAYVGLRATLRDDAASAAAG